MKRILPLLLVLLLLAACGAPADREALPSPESGSAAPAESPAAAAMTEPDEDELPIQIEGDEPVPTEEPGTIQPPALSDTQVTLDGLSSFLRVTLPQGWTWEQAAGTVEGTVYGLYPENDPDFKVELHYWPNRFGMCGTGVTFQDYTLPDGRTATLAYEIIDESIFWTLILPESPDSFTIQFAVPYALYEAHRAELELMLGTIQQGVLANLDVAQPETATG